MVIRATSRRKQKRKSKFIQVGKMKKEKKVIKKFKKDRADYEKKKGKAYYCPAK